MDAEQIVLDCLKQNKTGKMEIHVLHDKCVKVDPMMEYEFRYTVLRMLCAYELGLTPTRKIYVRKD